MLFVAVLVLGGAIGAKSPPDTKRRGDDNQDPALSAYVDAVELAGPSLQPHALRASERLRFEHGGEGCPRYEVTVFEDGRVAYLGRGGVWVRGRRARTLGGAELDLLAAALARLPVDRQYVPAPSLFERFEPWAAHCKYERAIAFRDAGGVSRYVVHHWNSDSAPPEDLRDLEREVVSRMGVVRWTSQDALGDLPVPREGCGSGWGWGCGSGCGSGWG